MPPSDLVRRPHVTAMHVYMTNLAHGVLLIERENALRQGSNGKQLLLNLRKSLWMWEKAGPDKKNSYNKCLWYRGVSGVLVQKQVNQSKGMRVWGQGVSGSVSENAEPTDTVRTIAYILKAWKNQWQFCMNEWAHTYWQFICGFVLKVKLLKNKNTGVVILAGEEDYAASGMRENITWVIRFSIYFLGRSNKIF